MTISKAVLIDLDGTLCDDRHRRHWVDPDLDENATKEWDEVDRWGVPIDESKFRWFTSQGELWKPDYEAYYAAMGGDKPYEWCLDILIRYAQDYRCQMPSVHLSIEFEPAELIFITGRPEKYRNLTLQWIEHIFAPKGIFLDDHLFMRPDFLIKATPLDIEGNPCILGMPPSGKFICKKINDHRPSPIVKKEIYEREIKNKYEVLFVLEDSEECCQMYKELGLTVLKVMR